MEKKFSDIYYKIYNENGVSRIEKLHHKRSLTLLKLFGIIMLIGIIFPKTLIITFPVYFIYAIISSSKKQIKKEEEYNNLYKEKLVLPLLKEIFKDIEYNPNETLPLEKYLEAEYKDNYANLTDINEYNSNDHIIIPIKICEKNIVNLDIYDVHLQTNNGDSKLIIFQGLTGVINLSKDIQTKIKLNPNVINLNFIDFSNNKKDIVSTDISEFNKYFSIVADNEILAMRIFTSDTIEKIMNILKNKKMKFNINIINNKLYVRVSSFSTFELTIVLNKEKYKVIEQEIIALEVMKELSSIFYKIIDDIDI